MRKVLVGVVLYFIFFSVSAHAQDYYVDATGGDDSKDGLSPENAWKTINKVNEGDFSPGDNVLFKRGEIWREQLRVPSPGSAGNPITFGSYGSGDNPLIFGSTEVIGVSGDWTDTGGNIWKRSLTTEAKYVVFDSTHVGVEDATSDAQYEWDWVANELFVYSVGNPTGYYSSIEAGQRSYCISVSEDYITIDGIDCKYANSHNILFFTGSLNAEVKNLKSSYCGEAGIYLQGSNHVCNIDNVTTEYTGTHGIVVIDSTAGTIQNCDVSYWGSFVSGSYVWYHALNIHGSSNLTIENNHLHHYASGGQGTGIGGDRYNSCTIQNNEINNYYLGGIDLTGATNEPCHSNIVRYNVIHDGDTTSGVAIQINANVGVIAGTYSNQVYYNVIYNDKRGIELVGDVQNNVIYNNVVYNMMGEGLLLYDRTGSDKLYDNILKNNIVHTAVVLISIDSGLFGASYNNILDNNCYYDTSFTNKFSYGSRYSNLVAWQTATSQDANAIAQDPLFVNALANDFRLQPSSPCIDAGIDVGLTLDFEGNPIINTPDIGAYEYAGGAICEPNTYYVDATNGDDNNDGMCTNTAWKTIGKVNSMSFGPGDNILFKKGEIWRERLRIPSSGSSGNPITFGAYGSGNNPLILGSAEVIGVSGDWADEGSNVWKRALTTETKYVVFDSTHVGVEDATSDAQYEWDWIGSELFVYSVGNPTGYYSSIEAGQRSYCISVSEDYITIDGIDCKYANSHNILFFTGSLNAEVKNLKSSYCGEAGIYLQGSNHVCNIDNVTTLRTGMHGVVVLDITAGTIQNCDISYWGCINRGSDEMHGINIHGSSNLTVENNHVHHYVATAGKGSAVGGDRYNNCIIQDNEFNNYYLSAIDMSGGAGEHCHSNIVRYNLIHDGDTTIGFAIHLYAGSPNVDANHDNQVYYNIIYNDKRGIDLSGDCYNNTIYNNVIYNMIGEGLLLDDKGSGFFPYNNTLKNNIVHTAGVLIYVDDGLFSALHNNILDNNCYYDTSFANKFHYVSRYSNLAAWRTATSQDANAVAQDPLFVNAMANDFHLQASSPCIDAGIDVGLTLDFEGNPVPQGNAPDIGAYEYASEIPGDLDNDGDVDVEDLILVATNFGKTSGFDPEADVIQNGEIDIYDIVFVASRFT